MALDNNTRGGVYLAPKSPPRPQDLVRYQSYTILCCIRPISNKTLESRLSKGNKRGSPYRPPTTIPSLIRLLREKKMFKQFCCKGVEASGVGGTRVEQLFCVTLSPLSISFPPYCVSSELLQYTEYEFSPLCDYNYKRVVFFYCWVRTRGII